MISGVLLCTADCIYPLERAVKAEAAFHTDEQVRLAILRSYKDLSEFLKRKISVDIICMDITVKGGITYAEQLRKVYPKASMILLADISISPVMYMKPTILAAALLLKPLQEEQIQSVIHSVLIPLIQKEPDDELFVIETREDKWRIPVQRIMYFEAREKKIYACTKSEEYGFYSTVDALEERMKKDYVRCHRSYLARKDHIEKIMLSKNLLILKDGTTIPISRSYKPMLKDLF